MKLNNKISIALFIIGYAFQVKAQSKIAIEYLYSTHLKNSEELSKKIMKEYDIYLLIDTLELKVEKISDSLLIGPTLTDAQCQQLMHKPDVIVKLYDGKHCFITMFPNVFTVNTQEIVNLTIGFYKDYFGHLVVHYAHWGFRYGSEKIYPCKRYKGQFDR